MDHKIAELEDKLAEEQASHQNVQLLCLCAHLCLSPKICSPSVGDTADRANHRSQQVDKAQLVEKLRMQRQQEYEELYQSYTELQSRYQHLQGVMQAVSAGVNNPANGQPLAIFTSVA